MNASNQTSGNLVDLLDRALAPHGLRPHFYGQFIRLPAIWSGRRDYCVSVAPNGAWTDFSSGEKGRLRDLLKLLKIDEDPNRIVLKPVSKEQIEKKQAASMRLARRTWDQGAPVCAAAEGEIVRRYLKNRGLPEGMLRHIHDIARVRTESADTIVLMLPMFAPCPPYPLIGMQRIFLDHQGHKTGQEPKQMLGVHKYRDNAFAGCLIAADPARVKPQFVTLVLCEGYETGLAIHAASGYAVYVLYDRGGLQGTCTDYLRRLNPQRIIIGADNDDPDSKGNYPGQEAALRLGLRLEHEKIAYQIALPPRSLGGGHGADWLDVWNADPDSMLWLLNRPRMIALPGNGQPIRIY